MPEKKNQHYVPQMHLRYFVTDKEKELINLTILKSKKHIQGVSINKQASEDYFYGNDGKLEDALGLIESGAGNIFKAIVNDLWLPNPGSEEHHHLLIYILFAISRTKKRIDKFNETTEHLRESLRKKSEEWDKHPQADKLTVDDPFKLLFSITAEKGYLAMDLHYKLLVNESEDPFILSDHPAVTYNELNNFRGHPLSGGRGLASKGLQIFFPLSPTRALFFYDPWAYTIGSKGSAIVKLRNNRSIWNINVLQVLNANEVLFYNDDPKRKYIDKLLGHTEKMTPFDNPKMVEIGQRKVSEEEESALMLNIVSTPTIKLNIETYAWTKAAKLWKPDNMLVQFRTEAHKNEHFRSRR